MEENKPPGPLSPPKCRHGKAGRNCAECRVEDTSIKKLTNPLVDEWWDRKGENISLYHIVYRAYHMGMRNEHLKED